VDFEHFGCDIKHTEQFFERSGKTGRKGQGTISKINLDK